MTSGRSGAEPVGEATIENGASFGERSEPTRKPQPAPNVTERASPQRRTENSSQGPMEMVVAMPSERAISITWL